MPETDLFRFNHPMSPEDKAQLGEEAQRTADGWSAQIGREREHRAATQDTATASEASPERQTARDAVINEVLFHNVSGAFEATPNYRGRPNADYEVLENKTGLGDDVCGRIQSALETKIASVGLPAKVERVSMNEKSGGQKWEGTLCHSKLVVYAEISYEDDGTRKTYTMERPLSYTSADVEYYKDR